MTLISLLFLLISSHRTAIQPNIETHQNKSPHQESRIKVIQHVSLRERVLGEVWVLERGATGCMQTCSVWMVAHPLELCSRLLPSVLDQVRGEPHQG